MHVKRRYLPDFETSSLLLFALLAAGAVQPVRAQFSIGPTRSTAASTTVTTATTATTAISTRQSSASSAARAATGELSTRKDGSAKPVPKTLP